MPPHREPDEEAGKRSVRAVAALVGRDAGEIEEHAHVVVGQVVARYVIVDRASQAVTCSSQPFVHGATLLLRPVGVDR